MKLSLARIKESYTVFWNLSSTPLEFVFSRTLLVFLSAYTSTHVSGFFLPLFVSFTSSLVLSSYVRGQYFGAAIILVGAGVAILPSFFDEASLDEGAGNQTKVISVLLYVTGFLIYSVNFVYKEWALKTVVWRSSGRERTMMRIRRRMPAPDFKMAMFVTFLVAPPPLTCRVCFSFVLPFFLGLFPALFVGFSLRIWMSGSFHVKRRPTWLCCSSWSHRWWSSQVCDNDDDEDKEMQEDEEEQEEDEWAARNSDPGRWTHILPGWTPWFWNFPWLQFWLFRIPVVLLHREVSLAAGWCREFPTTPIFISVQFSSRCQSICLEWRAKIRPPLHSVLPVSDRCCKRSFMVLISLNIPLRHSKARWSVNTVKWAGERNGDRLWIACPRTVSRLDSVLDSKPNSHWLDCCHFLSFLPFSLSFLLSSSFHPSMFFPQAFARSMILH